MRDKVITIRYSSGEKSMMLVSEKICTFVSYYIYTHTAVASIIEVKTVRNIMQIE